MATEKDPNGKSAKEPGSKLDAGKSPMFRGLFKYFPRALMAVGSVSGFGAEKYAWGGWATVADGFNRYSDALGRHQVKEEVEGLYDRESGHLHAAHAAWNALARLELLMRDLEAKKAEEEKKMPPVKIDGPYCTECGKPPRYAHKNGSYWCRICFEQAIARDGSLWEDATLMESL